MRIERLLLPVKGGAVDESMLSVANSLIDPRHGHIFALYVIEIPRVYPVDVDLPQEILRGEAVLHEVEEYLKKAKCPVTAEFLQAREAGSAVVKEAVDREIDLVLMGMSFKRKHGTFSVGHTVSYVLENAPCPVMILREAALAGS